MTAFIWVSDSVIKAISSMYIRTHAVSSMFLLLHSLNWPSSLYMKRTPVCLSTGSKLLTIVSAQIEKHGCIHITLLQTILHTEPHICMTMIAAKGTPSVYAKVSKKSYQLGRNTSSLKYLPC